MKIYHVYERITRTGENRHTEWSFEDKDRAQGLVDLIDQLGNGKIVGFIHTVEI